MHESRLVLASASPRRQELLRQCGVAFDVVPPAVSESDPGHLTASEVCLLNAHRKARAVGRLHPNRLILGADTMVVLGARRLGKPEDHAAARRMLGELAGHTHEVITGVCLLALGRDREQLFSESTRVTFRPLSDQQIREYLTRVNPLDKAGAYALQEHGDLIVSGVDGSAANVIGLPVERLLEELRRWDA